MIKTIDQLSNKCNLRGIKFQSYPTVLLFGIDVPLNMSFEKIKIKVQPLVISKRITF